MIQQREILFKELGKLMGKDKKVFLLYIDLGYSFIENIQKKFFKRCINTGAIEQSAINIAAGLARGGKKVFIYSASTFLIFRAFEQVRSICYQNLNVKLLGFAGKNYNFLGYSHLPQKKEDIKILKLLPNIKIYEPQSKEDVKKAIEKEADRFGPAYIRLT